MKFFETYDLQTITQCQFYPSSQPFSYLFDCKRKNVYSMLNDSHVNHASILFHWFVQSKVSDIANEYNISDTFNKFPIMWTSFEKYCNTIGYTQFMIIL